MNKIAIVGLSVFALLYFLLVGWGVTHMDLSGVHDLIEEQKGIQNF